MYIEPPDAASTAGETPLLSSDEHATRSLRPVLDALVIRAARALRGCHCTVQLATEPGVVRTVAASDPSVASVRQSAFPLGVGVAGWVARTLTPVRIDDVAKDPRYLPLGNRHSGSIICTPIVTATACYGTLTAWSSVPHAFDDHALAVLSAYADGAAITIAHMHRTPREAALLAFTQAVLASGSIAELCATALPMIAAAVPFAAGALVYEGYEGSDTPHVHAFAPNDACDAVLAGQVQAWAASAWTTWATDSSRDKPLVPLRDTVDGFAMYALPLVSAGHVLGFLAFAHTLPYDANARTSLRTCGDAVCAALAHVRADRHAQQGFRQFEAAFMDAADGLLLLDATGTTALWANAAFYRLTGITTDAVVLPAPLSALAQQWPGEAEPLEPLEPLHLPRWELRPLTARTAYVEMTESLVAVDDVRYRLRTLHDATAIQHEQQARTEFISIVSHELRHPLASIYGFLDLLMHERVGPLTTAQRTSVQFAHFGVRQLRRLVDDIIDLSQADLNRLTLQCEQVNVEELIRNVCGYLQPMLVESDLTVKIVIPNPLPHIIADPIRVQQILNNLLTNAIRFSAPATAIRVEAEMIGPEVHIGVRDTGPGIPPEEIERIFERFARGTSVTRSNGLGLGLAVVRQLAHAHNGRVWIESEMGKGSTLRFTLPLTPAE